MTSATAGKRIYAIGDIHGLPDVLDDMMARLRDDLARRPHRDPLVIFLGDFIDRGPDSRGVLERLSAIGRAGDPPARFIIGNHDTCLLRYLDDPNGYETTLHWLHPRMGGAATLASYGVEDATHRDPEDSHAAFAAAVPAAHVAFLQDCERLIEVGTYVFSHAGIRPGVPLDRQSHDDLMWIREPFLSDAAPRPYKVVHGHTVVKMVEHHPNRIAVDTGAVHGGYLSCVVLEDDTCALLEARGLRDWPEGSGLGLSGMGSALRNRLRGKGPR